MSSRHSYNPSRRMGSSRDIGRARATSRAQPIVVEHDDARSFALRSAYLHYLLQPKTKRKQYVPAPKQPVRTHTSVGMLVQEFTSGSSSSMKLPHNFSFKVLNRVTNVVKGQERVPGFNDAAIKRTFAEAYITFSEDNFKRTIDKERKVEPLILMFYSAATKAAQKGAAPDDDSWKTPT